MIKHLLSLTALAAASAVCSPAALADSHALYELRTYYANEGKIDALHERFRNHTMKLFEKHGMQNAEYQELYGPPMMR